MVEEDAHQGLGVESLRYRRDIKSFIMKRYRTIKSRIKNHSLYKNVALCTRDEFLNFSLDCKELTRLFKEWQNSGFRQHLVPSVDRINPKRGYMVDNIRWVTHSDNSKKGGKCE